MASKNQPDDPRGSAEPDPTRPDPNSTEHTSREALSRRALLIAGSVAGATVVASGVVLAARQAGSADADNAATPAAAATPKPTPDIPTREFVSTTLKAPKVTIRTWGTTAPGYILVDPKLIAGAAVDSFLGLIMDDSGEPVWMEPTGVNLTDLRVQSYHGQPVLTYWSGKSVAGHGDGHGTILDSAYRTVAEVHAGNGLEADLHEFNLTDRGTALITSYPVARADISFFGGPRNGYIYECHVQEIDIATGTVLLDWNASDHIDMSESFRKIGDRGEHDGTSHARAFDPIHLNAADDDGDQLLISSRYTKAIYAVDRQSGAVRWRLGGRRSDFDIAADAQFAWQHDVRRNADGTISLFDNHRWTGDDGASRGLVFDVDVAARTATLKQAYAYDGHLGNAMGSTQVLPNGNVLVGWGTEPVVTEFSADGTALFEATQVGAMAYRAQRAVWSGRPTTAPDLAVDGSSGSRQAYASWNGATDVASWRVLAATGDADLTPVATHTRNGFETTMPIGDVQRVSVQALDATGSVLGTSAVVAV